MPVAIIPASLDDAPAVNALHAELGYPVELEDTRSRMAALAATGVDDLFLLARDGAPLGMLAMHYARSLNYAGGIARIADLVLAEAARGQGLGRLLVDHAIAEARARGHERLELTSGLHRPGAHAFYRRLGFEETSIRFRLALAG